MLDVTDSRNFSRTLGAIALVAGPLLWLASSAVSPAWAEDTGDYLAEIAAAPNRHLLSAGLFLLGCIVLLPGLLATAHLLRGRRVTVGQIGASILAVGAMIAGGVVFVINAFEVVMVDDAANRTEMIALSERGEDSLAAGIVFFVSFFGGFVLGLVLLAVGLWTKRAVPVWSPLLLVGAIAWMFVGGEGQLGSIVGMAVLVAGFAPIAAKILALSDEEWARWQPLPDGGRRPARTEELGPASTA